jgi:hypothetical protein
MGRQWEGVVRALALGLLLLLSVTPTEGRRLALVIGNDTYKYATHLRNARADAVAVAEALERVGFKVTRGLDLDREQMMKAWRDFPAQVAKDDEVVFYFAGHGVQFGGSNYLIPVDLNPKSEGQVADDSLPLQRVLEDLKDKGFTLAIIDACRDNPFKVNGRSIGKRGLAAFTTATDGQVVLYSAGAGQEALDDLGPGDPDPNGLFTRVFIKEIKKPGVAVDQMLTNVRAEVVRLAKTINHQQTPALYSQANGADVYFAAKLPGAASAPPAAPPAAAVRVQSADELEQSFWNRIQDSTDFADFAAYTAAFPHGAHHDEAALIYRRLNRSTAPAGANSPPSEPRQDHRQPPERGEEIAHRHAAKAEDLRAAVQSIVSAIQEVGDVNISWENVTRKIRHTAWERVRNPRADSSCHIVWEELKSEDEHAPRFLTMEISLRDLKRVFFTDEKVEAEMNPDHAWIGEPVYRLWVEDNGRGAALMLKSKRRADDLASAIKHAADLCQVISN